MTKTRIFMVFGEAKTYILYWRFYVKEIAAGIVIFPLERGFAKFSREIY